MPQIISYYSALYQRNITVDFAHPAADLSKYKLVIAPHLYMVNDSAVANLTRYVENGGNLLTTFFSGLVDENEHIRLGGYPAPFRDLLGLAVEEYVPYGVNEFNTINTTDNKQFQCTFWSDVIRLKSAQALATYEQDYYSGNPAVTRNKFGKGIAFYVGTILDHNGMDWLVEQFCKTAGIKLVTPNAPAGIELVRRTDGTQTWLFALNHSGEGVNISLNEPGYEILSGTNLDTNLHLAPTDVAIIQLPASSVIKE